MSIYDINIEHMDGHITTLEEHKGKVLLIVNTASKCGYTPQLQDMQDLYRKYKDKGLEIIGIPSGQFLRQEFSTNTEIMAFCRENYGVSFPMYAKSKVKGKRKAPIFQYLIEHTPVRQGKQIKWNFEKFLVNKNGEIINRYSSKVNPRYIAKDIELVL